MRQTYHIGFTLIELLVTITVFLLVMGAIFEISIFSQRFYTTGETQAELLQNGRVILERITREIHQTEEVVTPLPKVLDDPDNPPLAEIEFQDGHFPSPYEDLNSDYYYIRYYLSTSTNQVSRQYRVYCFDPCSTCNSYFRWNSIKIEDEQTIYSHPCNLEEKIIGEYVSGLKIWGVKLIQISLNLEDKNETFELRTKVFGRNL